jgi:hypothetical protein
VGGRSFAPNWASTCDGSGANENNAGHIKGSPLQSGPLISKAANLSAFADYKENAFLLFKLNKRLKIFRGEDGWFARGRMVNCGNMESRSWDSR